MPAPAEIRLEIPPRLDYLAVVRLVVATAAALDPPLPDSRLDDLRLAVTEACSNAIKAHRTDAGDQPVVVTCHLDDEQFRVEIHDRGPGFDPADIDTLPEASDPSRLNHESGLGIPLIRVLTDHASFEPTDTGTVVSMSLLRSHPRPS